MAVMTSSHMADVSSPDLKQPTKMASLADEHLPTSNGVNGHSDDTLTAPKPMTDSLETPEVDEKTEDYNTVDNISKNADVFTSNASLLEDESPGPRFVGKPAEEDGIQTAPAEKSPSDETEKKEEEVVATVEAVKEATPAVLEASTEAPERQSVEPLAEQVVDEPAPVEAEEVSPVAVEEEKAAQSPVESAAKPGADDANALAPVATPGQSSEAVKPASPSPVVETAEKDVDVEMSGVVPEASTTSIASFTATATAPAKSESPVKAKSPSAPAPTTHSLSSSLLPSLRDDRSRGDSLAAGAGDTAMSDAPALKVSREREDDDETGRSPKRAKTADVEAPASADTGSAAPAPAPTEMQIDAAPVTMPARVRSVAKEGSLADVRLDDSPITPYANREIRRVLASVKKTKAGLNFKDPVHKKWPMLWDTYTARVSKPVDIGLLERNLREGIYTSHSEFINDLFLIFENSVSFNGLGNAVTDEAKSLVDNFFTRLSEISAQEPQRSEKKDPKQLPTRQTEPRAAASRRESRGAATSPIEESVIAMAASPMTVSTSFGTTSAAGVTSPGAAAAPAEASTPVFAVPASGVPIIRRDSAKNDGDRPKRPIHPPKNRDLGYEPKNPKKKQPEFRFCEEVLKELMKLKHYEVNHWFLKPVDPVAMQIPTYHKVIKKPMDLGTMQTKLNGGEYASAKDFEADFSLIVKNCRKFNIVGEVVDSANRLEDLFKQKWAEKDSWIAAHTTQTAVAHSPTGKDDDSDDEAEDSDDEGGEISVAPLSSDIVDALVKRLEEENTRLNKLLAAHAPDMTAITTQQTVTNMIQKQLVEEKIKLANAEAERRTKKSGKARPSKSKKASGGSGSAAKKSSSGGSKKVFGAAVKKSSKARVLGQAEKNVVTEGINNLDGQQLEKAIEIIKRDTSQEESESGELELDIDQLTQDALGKLYDLIVKAFPHMRIKQEKSRAGGDSVVKPSKPKKHKPMGKAEQERNIEKLREIKAQFQRPGSGSQEPLPSVEMGQMVEEEESEEESEVDSEEE